MGKALPGEWSAFAAVDDGRSRGGGDVIKKQGPKRIMEEPEVRRHFVEEMCDVMMYFNDLMICFGISSDELAEQYRAKHRCNMTRR